MNMDEESIYRAWEDLYLVVAMVNSALPPCLTMVDSLINPRHTDGLNLIKALLSDKTVEGSFSDVLFGARPSP